MLQALGVSALILAARYFWFPMLVIGRGVFLLAAVFVISMVAGWRVAYEWVTGQLGHRERLLLVGTNAASVALAKEMFERRELGTHRRLHRPRSGTGGSAGTEPRRYRHAR